jgi:predicted O-methyltransferase YrrM
MIFSVDWAQEADLLDAIHVFEDALLGVGVLKSVPSEPHAFLEFFEGVQKLRIDQTAITAAMLKLLFDLGYATGSANLVGIGTYQGLPISALTAGARLRSDGCNAVGIDVEPESNIIARDNANHLGLSQHLQFVDGDGAAYLEGSTGAIDLLYLDLDDEHIGKKGYVKCFLKAIPYFSDHAVVLAHDAISPKFTKDLEDLRRAVASNGRFDVLLDIPIDSAGLFLAGSAESRRQEER